MSEPYDIPRFFSNLRLDERTHLGLGDIRLTVADQASICARISELEAERDGLREAVQQALSRLKRSYDGGCILPLIDLLEAALNPDGTAGTPDDDDRMDICAEPGTKVLYDEGGGLEGERVEARNSGLIKGKVYTVRHVSVSCWSSLVVLDEIAGAFNTCLFAKLNPDAKPVGGSK